MNKVEKKTVGKMIHIYCSKKHGTTRTLCADCAELNCYAQRRLDKCTFGEDKPTCQKCTVHCYQPEMRSRIQNVMTFSGPRIILKSPVLAIKHWMKSHCS